MIRRFAIIMPLVMAALALGPAAQAQQFFADRGAAQASCPGAQVSRAKPPRGVPVQGDADGSSAYGAYFCQQPANAMGGNMAGGMGGSTGNAGGMGGMQGGILGGTGAPTGGADMGLPIGTGIQPGQPQQ